MKIFKSECKIMRLYLPQGNLGGKAWVLFGGFKTQVSFSQTHSPRIAMLHYGSKDFLIMKISDRDPGPRVLASREKDWRATTRDCVKGFLDFHLL